MSEIERLRDAIHAFELHRSPSKLLEAVKAGTWRTGKPERSESANARALAERLHHLGVRVLAYGDRQYPDALSYLPTPPAFLFYLGDASLLEADGVGMCGSRHASDEGLAAARSCGEVVARRGLTVISGNAKGVDAAAQAAAVMAGGNAILVVPEGIANFRFRKSLSSDGARNRLLILSQFHPNQPWNVGAAMTRNGVIAALGKALVVVEAGDTGGTLDAGLQALRMKRPVIALEFAGGSPKGNEMLFAKGALRAGSRSALIRAVDAVRSGDTDQLSLALA
jgi:DNA processing protein